MLKVEGNGRTYYELEAEEFVEMNAWLDTIKLYADKLFEVVPEDAAPPTHELLKSCDLIRDWMDDNITPRERRKAAKLFLSSAYGQSVRS